MRGSLFRDWIWTKNVWRPNSNVVEGDSIKVRPTLDSRTCLEKNMHRRTVSLSMPQFLVYNRREPELSFIEAIV